MSAGRRALVAFGIVVALAGGASGAAAKVNGAEAEAAARPVAFSLRIGNVLPFTGDLAAYGKNLDQAVRIAVQLQNEALRELKLSRRISVRLVASEDGQTQASAGVEAATKLVKANRVHVVIGEMASSTTIPIAQSVTIPNRVVQITPTSTAPQISNIPDRGYLWRILSSDTLQGRVLAQAAAGAFGARARISVGARNDAFGIALKNLFITQWKRGGGRVEQEVTWNPNQATFESEAQRLVRGNPAGFVIIDFPETFEKVAPALVRTGRWRPSRTLMTEAMRNATVLRRVGAPATEGLRGTAPTSEGAPARRAFDRIFRSRARGANPITGFEGSSFDAAMLAFLASVKAKSANPARIKTNLRAVSGPPGRKYTFLQLRAAIRAVLAGRDIDYEGAWGPIDWDRRGDPGSAVYEIWRYSRGSISTQRLITFRG